MSTILYGNVRIEIFDDLGARVSRLSMRAAYPPPRRDIPARPDRAAAPPGRAAQLSDAYTAVRDRRPIEFTAACGYGKTTLLRFLADSAAYQGVADVSVYLRLGADEPADIMQRLFAELYRADPPYKPTAGQCAELVGRTRALIVLDDVMLSPGGVEYLVRSLDGCGLALGSARPVLGRHGTSQLLPGLPDAAAVELVTRELGRTLAGGELAAVRQLASAVDGQPLHLRQAAALARETGRPRADLARIAGRDPDELDRLSVSRLAGPERRALAVLALAGGAALPDALVGAMGDVATIAQSLELLRRRGLAEQQADRFSLPVCKVASYRALVSRDVQLATAARAIIGWLANRDPSSADSLSAAGGALALVEWAADRGDWPVVVGLARAAEPVLVLAGRWEASRQVLDRGLEAARTTGDQAAQALFGHEQGTLALCRDELGPALRLLREALSLRERLGDAAGAAVTRQNLELLRPAPASSAPDPPRDDRETGAVRTGAVRRRVLAGAGIVACLLLAGFGVRALAGGRSGTPTSPASHSASASATPDTHAHGGGGGGEGGGGGGGGGGSSTPAASAPTVTVAAFGSMDITTGTPASQPVTVSNPGAGSLPITGVTLTPGPFEVAPGTDACSGTTLAPGQSCAVTVDFTPTAIGDVTATLTVGYGTGQAVPSTLSGTGSVTLAVTVPGNGSGSVTDGGIGLSCATSASGTAACSATIDSAGQTPVTLTASPDSGSQFESWGGACSGTKGDSCDLTSFTADIQVSADFSLFTP